MYFIERRLAHDEHEFAPLFQYHVGRAMNQVVAESVCDGGDRAHAARRDHHAQRYERAARDRGALIAAVVTMRGQVLYVFECKLGFMRERARRPLAHDQMCFDARTVQHLQEPHTEDRSGGAGYTHYES